MSEATYKATKRSAADPTRQQVAEEQLALDCAKRREFDTWFKSLIKAPPPQPIHRRF
jgi:hypothetical protein